MDIVGTVGEHWGRGIAHCDSGTVAHAGQEEGDEDSDGHTEPIQNRPGPQCSVPALHRKEEVSIFANKVGLR